MAEIREYETTYILTPDVAPEDRQRVADRVKGVIEGANGSILRTEDWGRRKLAYLIEKHAYGNYVYTRYNAEGAAIAELERNLRLLDPVIKFLTVRLEAGAPDTATIHDQDYDTGRDDDEDDEDDDEDEESED